MAFIEDRPQVQAAARLLTMADLAAMPNELPSGPVSYELDQGRLVMMSPTSFPHGSIQLQIGAHLKMHGEWLGHGKVVSEVGLVLERNPDTVLAPDLMFIAAASLPEKLSREGYLETIPELVVEVRSKNDTLAYYERRASVLLQAGVKLVWIVDPPTQTVRVFRAGAAVEVLPASAILTAEGIIPDFSVPVAKLFA